MKQRLPSGRVCHDKRATQAQMFYAQSHNIAAGGEVFCELVRAGEVSKCDLRALIVRRPARYARYAGFMDQLPEKVA